MACTLSNKCAKNHSKRTVLLQLIIKNVVTCFLEHSVYIFNSARMLAASMQCWRMVRALKSHGRCWLVVSSDEMSLYTSRSRTSSVTDRRLITDLSTAPYDQKDLCVFCRTYTSMWSRWQQNTAGPLKRPSSSTITSLHDITGSLLPVIGLTDFKLVCDYYTK